MNPGDIVIFPPGVAHKVKIDGSAYVILITQDRDNISGKDKVVVHESTVVCNDNNDSEN